MTFEEARGLFSGVRPQKLELVYKSATRKVGEPKTKAVKIEAEGEYNAVGLPERPHAVAAVKDASKDALEWKVVGQQVVASRRFVPPVEVTYLATTDYEQWRAALIDEMRRFVKAG